MHLSRTIFTRLGKQFQVNLVQFVNKSRSFKSCDAVNIQKRFKTRLSKPNLYVGPKKPTKFYEYPLSIGPYGYFLLSIPIGTFLLGTWQVQRRKWKLNLLQNLNDRIYHEPLEIPAEYQYMISPPLKSLRKETTFNLVSISCDQYKSFLFCIKICNLHITVEAFTHCRLSHHRLLGTRNLEQLAEMEYYPFKVKGTFLYDQEFPIGLRSLIVDGNSSTEGSLVGNNDAQRGYYIITPFKLSDRDLTILVNRGWVPRTLKNTAARECTQVKGEVEIIGVLRSNESRPQFVPKNSPQEDLWYYRDVNAMAKIAGTAPVYLDMKSDKKFSKYPIGSQTKVKLRNEHFSYIITWYSLSAFTGYMWYRQIIKKLPM